MILKTTWLRPRYHQSRPPSPPDLPLILQHRSTLLFPFPLPSFIPPWSLPLYLLLHPILSDWCSFHSSSSTACSDWEGTNCERHGRVPVCSIARVWFSLVVTASFTISCIVSILLRVCGRTQVKSTDYAMDIGCSYGDATAYMAPCVDRVLGENSLIV